HRKPRAGTESIVPALVLVCIGPRPATFGLQRCGTGILPVFHGRDPMLPLIHSSPRVADRNQPKPLGKQWAMAVY
ncbi:MAG TPA: hypothetical protein PL016_07385, partial [Kiritimatiellia bacterium]|nr:hypothetical protein [Kiritimatiellia bacterium]